MWSTVTFSNITKVRPNCTLSQSVKKSRVKSPTGAKRCWPQVKWGWLCSTEACATALTRQTRLSGNSVKSAAVTQSLPLPRLHTAYASTQLHFDYGQDVFLIREAVMGGERGVAPGRSICPKQPLSQYYCRPLVREAQLLLESSTVQKKGPCTHPLPPSLRHPSCPSFSVPPHPKHPCTRMKRTSDSEPLCSQPARLQFQTSLDHFSCSPEMNNAHINWCQLINFRLTALYFSIKVWRLHFVL